MGCNGSTLNNEINRDYVLGERLGGGAYGSVFAARPRRVHDKRLNDGAYAVKVLDLQGAEGKDLSKILRKDAENEVKILQQVMCHGNIVKMHGFLFCTQRCYIVMERCRCSVHDALAMSPPPCEANIVSILWEMLIAMRHVHSHRIVHRGITPENFLIGLGASYGVKLADFGAAIEIPKGGMVSGALGKPEFMAPEMLACWPYDYSVDIWSLGVTAHLLFYGDLPYEPPGDPALLMMMRWLHCGGLPAPPCRPTMKKRHLVVPSTQAEQFVRDLLTQPTSERMGVEEQLLSPLFFKVREENATSNARDFWPLTDAIVLKGDNGEGLEEQIQEEIRKASATLKAQLADIKLPPRDALYEPEIEMGSATSSDDYRSSCQPSLDTIKRCRVHQLLDKDSAPLVH